MPDNSHRFHLDLSELKAPKWFSEEIDYVTVGYLSAENGSLFEEQGS